jgi:probable rRNA maturation factor
MPGDIVISLETLRETSKELQIPQEEELRRLLIHGILHLDGMEHANNNNDPMLILQEDILNKLKNEPNIIKCANGGEK